jgi:N-acetylglucosamine kinase-like BadF-type ATPase
VKSGERILGIEGGGTKTAWVLVERPVAGGAEPVSQWVILDQGKLPPSNWRLTTPERLHEIFSGLPREIDRAGVFLAGCGTEEDRQSLALICRDIWPNAKIVTGSDRDCRKRGKWFFGDWPARRPNRESRWVGTYSGRYRRRLFFVY